MERAVGGGIGMGNTCKPTAVLFQCMTKSTTIKKIIKKKKKMRRQATDWEKISVNHIHIYLECRQTSQNSVV